MSEPTRKSWQLGKILLIAIGAIGALLILCVVIVLVIPTGDATPTPAS